MNLTIDKHISRLLFNNECVVLPEFGAFITRQYAAEVNLSTHMLRPSSKRVSFNPSIKENDGLLAQAVSVSESISYSQALESISISIRSWKRMLKAGKKINLPGVGRLYLDASAKIQFNPAIEINYDKSSYGLSIFRSSAIQREEEIEHVIHKAIEKHIPAKEKRKRFSAPFLFRAASVTAFVGLSISAGLYFGTHQKEDALSGLNPYSYFSTSDNSNSSLEANDILEEKPEPVASSTPVAVDNSRDHEFESNDLTENPLEKESKIEVKKDISANKSIDSLKEVSSDKKDSSGFHIIVGSFKDSKNATGYATDLKTKGFDAYVADGDSRFSRVAIGNYSSMQDAKRALLDVKSKVNSGAWVYTN